MILSNTTAEQEVLAMQPVEYRNALIGKCAFTLQTDVRKRNAWKRWQIYTEQHAPLVLDCILATQNDAGVRKELEKFVDLTVNPGLDITRQTAVCWRQGPRRSIEGASKDELAAFHELVLESKIDTLALAWNEIAEFVGPMIVSPAVRKGTLRWDVLLATYTDVETDPDDRHGTPTSAAWTVRSECDDPTESRVVVLDDTSWTTYEASLGASAPGEQPKEQIKPAGPPIPHDLGYFPGVPLRFDAVIDGDWWGSPFLNQRLVDATVRLGTLNAALAYTRKGQNKKLLAMIGDLGGFPDGQVLDPEVPFIADVPPGSGPPPEVTVLDFDTDPERFIKHAEWIYRNIANAYGGQVEADPQGITSRVTFSVETLTEIRNAQIPHARQFERELWATAVDMCRSMGHPLAVRLPTREQVLAGFRIDFGKLSRKFADPKQEAEHYDWLKSNGVTDQLEILRAQGNTTLDDEQLKDLATRHLENQSWFNNVLATRNLSLVDGKVASTAEANGAMGTAVRDGTPLAIGGAMPGPQGADGFAALPGAEPLERKPKIDPETGEPIEGEFEDAPAAAALPDESQALATAAAGDVQAAALNGAQITSFIELATAFAEGRLPLELGVQFLPIAFPGSVRDAEAAKRLLEPLRDFKPPQPKPSNADAFGADAPGDDNGGRRPHAGPGRFGGKPAGGKSGRPQGADQGPRRGQEEGARGRE